MIDDLMTREEFGYRDRDTQGKHYVKTKAESGVLQRQIKECQGLWATTRSWKSKRNSSRNFIEHGWADTSILGF